ncbi:hypothetical protein D5086_024193 [Populus alba]|uniref:Uncharacterized protein n=1 Tax=Populus alba TaxID=43335 RepID=A0ACC4B5F2_POPAL
MVRGSSLSDGHHHVDGDFKKGFLESREKETGVEEKELTPVQEELVEALVWFKKRNFTTTESSKAKISTMASCSAHQSVNPPWRDGKLWCVLIKIMDADDVARGTAASERSTAQENNNGDHGTVAGQAFHGSQASEEGARISQA